MEDDRAKLIRVKYERSTTKRSRWWKLFVLGGRDSLRVAETIHLDTFVGTGA